MKAKEAIMIGGPNGAGKTTAAFTLLPADLRIREFVIAERRRDAPFIIHDKARWSLIEKATR